MKKIGLIIGETSSLPEEIIGKYGMILVPYLIDWREGENLPGENIFQKMREAEKRGIKALPKTSQPSPWTFKKFFGEELQKSEKIICITLSSKLSGGYNSALQGRKMLPEKDQNRVHIIDSLNVTAGEGLFSIKAAELIEEGLEIEQITSELKKIIPHIHLFGFIEDPKWLEAGGRLSHSLAVLIRQMAKIGMRPLIGLKEGEVKPIALKMQAKDVPTALFKELKKETKNFKKVRIAIVHADNLEGANRLKNMLEKENIKISFLSLIDSVIGVHVGPGTIACAWHPV